MSEHLTRKQLAARRKERKRQAIASAKYARAVAKAEKSGRILPPVRAQEALHKPALSYDPQAWRRDGKEVSVAWRDPLPAQILKWVMLILSLSWGVLAHGPTFLGSGGYVTTTLGLAIGIVIATMFAWLDWSLGWSLIALTISYLLIGPAVADQSNTIAGFIPTFSGIANVAAGLIYSWKDLLTVAVPVASGTTISLVPFVSGLVAGWLSTWLFRRTPHPPWACVPAGLLVLVGMLWGMYTSPFAILIGLGFTITTLIWLAWDRELTSHRGLGDVSVQVDKENFAPSTQQFSKHGVRFAPARFLSAALGLALAFGSAYAIEHYVIKDPERLVLRDKILPPLELQDYPSPLQSYRNLVKNLRDEPLFTVEGLAPGQRVRLLALERYDGVVYNLGENQAGAGGFTKLNSFGNVPSGILRDAYVKAGLNWDSLNGRAGVNNAALEQAKDKDEKKSEGELSNPFKDPLFAPRLQTMKITVGKYSDVWLPGGGAVHNVAFANAPTRPDPHAAAGERSLFYNPNLGAVLAPAGVGEGDTYSVALEVAPTLTDAQIGNREFGNISMPSNDGTPEAIDEVINNLDTETQVSVKKARQIANQLSTTGFYASGSDGNLRPGHRAERIEAMLKSKQIMGDDEQYAVTMALIARDLNMPARIVMGFYPQEHAPKAEETQTGAPLAGPIAIGTPGTAAPPVKNQTVITGKDAHIWVEVNFDGIGWVPFDPTPPPNQVPQATAPKPKQQSRPQVIQPPDIPENPPAPPPRLDNKKTTDEEAGTDWMWYVRVVALSVGGTALVISPFVLILGYKLLRMRKRRNKGKLIERAHNTWRELLDIAVDCGLTIPRSATRVEGARQMNVAFRSQSFEGLARKIDAYTCTPDPVNEKQVSELWSDVATAKRTMKRSLPIHKRLASALSLATVAQNQQRKVQEYNDERKRKAERKRKMYEYSLTVKKLVSQNSTAEANQKAESKRAKRDKAARKSKAAKVEVTTAPPPPPQ